MIHPAVLALIRAGRSTPTLCGIAISGVAWLLRNTQVTYWSAGES